MTETLLPASESDADLWQQVRDGNTAAFERVVRRHQSMVCAVAYGACGDLVLSEDVAQETFWAAWRERALLQDPIRLRGWLCGIARNLGNNARRKEARTPAAMDETLPVASTAPGPMDSAVSREEQVVVWRALEQIPQSYREPLILFYREDRSVAEVAGALGLSEEAAKQRLSRGRGMLRERVAEVVEGTLRRSRPGPGLTIAVMAGLAAASAGAKSAFGMVVSAGTKALVTEAAGTALKASGVTVKASILGSVLGPFLGLLGGWLGTWIPAQLAPTKRERDYVLHVGKRTTLVSALFTIALIGTTLLFANTVIFTSYMIFWVVWIVAFASYILCESLHLRRAVKEMRAEALPSEEPNDSPVRARFTALTSCYRGRVYRSRAALFGLPLIDINVSNPMPPGPSVQGMPPRKRRVARGWIAIGDDARGILVGIGHVGRGFLAIGGRTLGVVSIGGIALGLFAVGGLGLGVVSVAGVAAGVWGFGGLALGWQAAGGAAIGYDTAVGGAATAWHAVYGGAALAHDFAVGGGAWAAHANDDAAKAVLLDHPLVLGMNWYAANLELCVGMLLVVVLLPVAMWPLMYRRDPPTPRQVGSPESAVRR
jgi:RNA polymerase sigma factor (sigma-70 family)